jgi:hypothetical protein
MTEEELRYLTIDILIILTPCRRCTTHSDSISATSIHPDITAFGSKKTHTTFTSKPQLSWGTFTRATLSTPLPHDSLKSASTLHTHVSTTTLKSFLRTSNGTTSSATCTEEFHLPPELQAPSVTSNLEDFPTVRPDDPLESFPTFHPDPTESFPTNRPEPTVISDYSPRSH